MTILFNRKGLMRMGFTTFFTQQARKPAGLFGRWVMAGIFNIGNSRLNRFVYDVLSPQTGDHILEIGCGTGKLVRKIVGENDGCVVEGVDFSDTMAAIARRNNKHHIAAGRVVINKGNFDEMSFQPESFTKICSVNTIYFWPNPEYTARKMVRLLKPGGMVVVGFEDKAQLERRRLDTEVFRIYSNADVEALLHATDVALDVTTQSTGGGASLFNCTVAIKHT